MPSFPKIITLFLALHAVQACTLREDVVMVVPSGSTQR